MVFSTITSDFARGLVMTSQNPCCMPVWKVCIARRISPARNFDAFYIITIKFLKSPARNFQTFQSGLHVALEQQSKIEILYTVKHNIFTKTLINTQNVTKFIKQYFYNERKITYRSVNNRSTSSNDIIRHFVYCQ